MTLSPAVTLLSAALTTSSQNTPSPGWSNYGLLRAQLRITAVSGTTPTLDMVLEDAIDGTNYSTIGTFPQQTAAGIAMLNISAATVPWGDTLRARWVVGGTTPSFTCSLVIVGR